MEMAEVTVKRILHTLAISDVDKAHECVSIFSQLTSAASRVKIIQAMIFTSEYVHPYFSAMIHS